MNGMTPVTIAELKQKWTQALSHSEMAMRSDPSSCRELTDLLHHVVSDTIDIGQYFSTARRLALLLQKLNQRHSGPIFQYFYRNIDPLQEGDPRFLRGHCMDLAEQLKNIRQQAAAKSGIRVIKG